MSVDKRNAEGYIDPTAYEAITAIVKETRSGRTFRPLVYICSPYSGDVEAHTASARHYCRFAVDSGCIPVAPHLLYPQFLDDADPDERELGIFFGNVLLSKCAELWVFGQTPSPGMAAEIDRAKRKNQHIRYFTDGCKEVALCAN